MLPINRLKEYQAEVVAQLKDDQNKKLYNYTNMIVEKKGLSKLLQERLEEDNTYLISVLPEFRLKGEEDAAKWVNVLSFFILDKTAYSEHDHDSFINIFATTQIKAKAFVDKLLEDKSNHDGMFCGFLSYLDENSIAVNPVWHMDGCNGWVIDINLDSNA
ncbi:hypothetical protein AAGV28_07185 [Flavobacterium sp. FZUC8N2.13]|uniref:Uncharacterized protein n=1 Tax=Flavobacterium zubiriense TaxID=3138075 RepID=A0ABV4TCP0_9FLAO